MSAVLDRVISIERKRVTRDGDFGSEQVTWSTRFAQVRARVWESSAPPSSNPTEAQMASGYVRPHRIRIRWRDDIDPTLDRVNNRGRILKITGTAEVGRRQWLDLSCDEWAHEQQ